jgi:hypothetical protein
MMNLHCGRSNRASESILAGRDFAAELVEEIKNESDLVNWRSLAIARSFQYGGPLAVRVHVII